MKKVVTLGIAMVAMAIVLSVGIVYAQDGGDLITNPEKVDPITVAEDGGGDLMPSPDVDPITVAEGSDMIANPDIDPITVAEGGCGDLILNPDKVDPLIA